MLPAAKSSKKAVSARRYAEGPSVNVRAGAELAQKLTTDAVQNQDGDLNVNTAETSLGQRLTVLTGRGENAPGTSSSDEETHLQQKQGNPNTIPEAVPASSLTRTLIQALHSSDANLLETCLAHSNATLIQNTARRLPPQLAIPLITACTERLGRGKGAGRGKGGGGGAAAQRGTGLIRWIRAVLIVHGGHLLTMPDLVARLAGLHATLSMRLALQDSLLSLSGRLDMVISQIEMRSSGAPAPIPITSKKSRKGRKKNKGTSSQEAPRYVEGESSEDGDGDEVGIEVESDGDGGSIDDIELGGEDGSSESDGESDEDDDTSGDDEEGEGDEDSEFGEGLRENGFIDDEAEEYSEEDEEESE